MAVFVLVHGAWEGGWCWRRVAEPLRNFGHQVYTPTLTGLGERVHLATPEVDLNTHIADVLGVFEAEELSDVVLCGHSYGGMVITGVAERVAAHVRALVYLDAFLPRDGQALLDLVDQSRRERFAATAAALGGWRIPPLTAAEWGITDPDDQAWVDRRSVPQPIATLDTPVRLSDAALAIGSRTYVLAGEYRDSPFHAFARQVRNDPSWRLVEVPCHHMINISMPDAAVQILLEAAAAGSAPEARATPGI